MGQPTPVMSRRRRWWYAFGVLVPILVTVISQLALVQGSSCRFFGIDAMLTQCEVWADLLAPAWTLALVPIAKLLRDLVPRYGEAPRDRTGWFVGRFATERWVIRSTWIATWCVPILIILSYTREWERFGEQPDVFWFVLVLVVAVVALLVPVWWMRAAIGEWGATYLNTGKAPMAIQRFLFDTPGGRSPRWGHVLAFSAVTALLAITMLGQFNSLVQGMRLPDAPSAGVASLASISELDLSQKPAQVVERVGAWREYTAAVGAEFGSAYAVVVAHSLIDTLVMIPAYLSIGLVLLLYAWRWRQRLGRETPASRSYELIVLFSLFVLLATAMFDLLENFFGWYVLDGAWNAPLEPLNASVRILWFCALARTVGMVMLVVCGVLLLALGDTWIRGLAAPLIAVRSELLLLTLLALVMLVPPQTADVIRGWRVSHTLITVGLAIAVAMLLRATSASMLRLQRHQWEQAQSPDPPRARRVHLPSGGTPRLGIVGAAALLVLALVQVMLSLGIGIPVGRGLLIPAFLIVVIWLLGVALPAARYVRGDRLITPAVRRRLPKLLASAVYLIIGVAVVKAAVGSVAYARHEDWYLFFALIPPAIGLWRILTGTTDTMGGIEAVFTACVALLGGFLLFVGNPELSPAALSFAGVTFAYGSLAFYNSYGPDTLASRASKRFLPKETVGPAVIVLGTGVVVAVLWLYVDPIEFAPRVGTVGVLLLALMVLAVAGHAVIRFSELTRPPKILYAFGIKRTPVVTLLLVWLLLAPTVRPAGIYDFRTTPASSPGEVAAVPSPGFEDIWERWHAANLGAGPTDSETDEREVVPLLLISSSGGGVRAAVWTSYVLDCIFGGGAVDAAQCAQGPGAEDPSWGSVAMLSGVSGGALGFASYVARTLDGPPPMHVNRDWVESALGDDYLAAAIGWMVYVDTPRSLLGFGSRIRDRSDIMEEAWEASWGDDVAGLRHGVLDVWERGPAAPAFVFNGTSVNDACRFSASAFDISGAAADVTGCAGTSADDGADPGGPFAATYDMTDFLCVNEDVRLSTAVSMSARFPIVATSGRMAGDPSVPCRSRSDQAVYVVDGGYLEGTGAGTLMDGWDALAPFVESYNAGNVDRCVVPFMIHIDNGYEGSGAGDGGPPPRELLVPVKTLVTSQSGRFIAARSAAALAFEQPYTEAGFPITVAERGTNGEAPLDGRYVRLVTRAHPGVQAPLGWTLSRASIDDLRDQLNIAENVAALEEIRMWLDGDLVCRR